MSDGSCVTADPGDYDTVAQCETSCEDCGADGVCNENCPE